MTALQKFIDDCKSNIDKLDSEGVVFNLSDYLETAIKIIERQRETLEKLRSGPGNNMAGWKQTWAHDFTGKCLAECEALAGGSEK